MKHLAIATLVLVASAGIARGDTPTAQLRLESGQPHAGVPFTLDLVANGFDESPQPDQPKLEIPGAEVTPLGAEPNVSRSIQIINGQRSDSTRVTWVMRWRVVVAQPGRMRVPAVTIVQGSKRATATAGEVDVDTVPTTDDMKLELALPDRPVFIGETVDAKLTWLFRRQPQDQTFSVPIMSLDDFTVSAPPVTDQRQTLTFDAGAKQLQLPYTIDTVDVGGTHYNRVTVHFFAAPRKSGKVEVPAASVVAALAVGRPDFFGNAPTRLFRASDVAHTLEVKPLPETDKPPGFAGAIGNQFSIAVSTSRSVVQLGEPVELAITVKSNQRLDALSLGRLDGDGGLPKDKFTVPAEPPTGELSDDGMSKTFKVTAQVTGPATEIPALAFSYFDPQKGTYHTIHSDPIALSVKGGNMIGADDVVAVAPKAHHGGAAAPTEGDLAQVGADLALSSPAAAKRSPLGGTLLWLLVGLLYAIPLGLWALRSWQLRTRTQREEAAEVRTARRKIEDELARATKDPARETAGPLAAALRALARALEREVDDDGLLARIETESFAPGAADAPLSSDVRNRAEQLMRRWLDETRRKPARPPRASVVVGLVLAALPARAVADPIPTGPAPAAAAPAAGPAAPGPASAPAPGPASAAGPATATAPGPATATTSQQDPLAEGRRAYQEALSITEASARRAAFERAAIALGEAARAEPDHPELLADWGNAALGAGDVATATLAYRRALALDGGNLRARRNLEWLRSRQADWLRPTGGSAADTLFFFHQWPRSRRWLVGAAAFALAVLLVVPWTERRRRAMRGLAVIPLAIWIAMIISLVIEDRHTGDAVVMDAVVLRAADSAGAPATLSQPLPRGAEVTIEESRDDWAKLRLANGTTGWVHAGAVERIAR